jgi:hypothetical protein
MLSIFCCFFFTLEPLQEMKRVREEEGEEEEEQQQVTSPDWGSLVGDLVVELVNTCPSLLPSLYLVSKHFRNALECAPPNAAFWKYTFNAVLGYSDYTPTPSDSWKALLKRRHQLRKRFYLVVQHPNLPCGNPLPASSARFLVPCRCGVKHAPSSESITSWREEKKEIWESPRPHSPSTIFFMSTSETVGCTWRSGAPYKYVWEPSARRIEYIEDFFVDTRTVLAAAPPADIPADMAWQVARFVGFV